MNNEPVAWMGIRRHGETRVSVKKLDKDDIPLYIHPVKEQLSNGHLSDCAIHNEPASKNKDCDCGFEPKFNLANLKHEDNCRYFDDELYCNCGADSYALVEWYRHKEVTHPVKEHDVKYDVTVRWDDKITHHKNVSVDTPLHYTHPVKELTDEEITICMGSLPKYNSEIVDEDLVNFARAILRKVQEK